MPTDTASGNQASGSIEGPPSQQIASRRSVKTSAVARVDRPEMVRSVRTRHHRTLRMSASRRLRAVGLVSAAWRRASAVSIAYVGAPDLGVGPVPSSCDIGPLFSAGITLGPKWL
ncbi:hypothetical protein AB8A21_03765 [Streptomyces sp. BF23-18]|uniref:hypothetical protein n=1 Tax=Streptomyces sp. BF23-18 TaxID=3240282 RepID=UPI0034E5CC93